MRQCRKCSAELKQVGIYTRPRATANHGYDICNSCGFTVDWDTQAYLGTIFRKFDECIEQYSCKQCTGTVQYGTVELEIGDVSMIITPTPFRFEGFVPILPNCFYAVGKN